MALPELIEIIPLAQPVRAEITVPGSKSITNRALILAALADGEVTLTGALWSEDTQIMVECLKELGFVVNVSHDPQEPCNRTIMVIGEAGLVPAGGTEREPLELFVGNAGTAARFLAPFLCLGSGVYRLSGVPRMHQRPQAALFSALRELGYRVESEFENDKLPARIYGEGPKKGKCRVSIEESSQFASALLLSAEVGKWQIEVTGGNEDEASYIEMTRRLIGVFPGLGGEFQIEPDASSGSYFWGCNGNYTSRRLRTPKPTDEQKLDWEKRQWRFSAWVANFNAGEVTVANWPETRWQIDRDFPLVFPFDNLISRQNKLGDSIMTAIVLAAFAPEKFAFTHLGRLRVQECERVVALRTELTKCGVQVIEIGDALEVFPSQPHGAEIETYNDHRMAMCFAILGLKVPGIKIKNPACVKKTFPNFFQKLAAAPPHGLGVEIWEVENGRRTRLLAGDDLFAD